MVIDTTTYDKSRRGIGNGFDNRTGNVKPITIIIHTTNGNINSSFNNEADYIYTTPKISSHYLMGKDGQIVQFLDPKYRAWHAGAVNDNRFNNNNSIGIEIHYSPGEGAWTQTMHSTLTELVTYLNKTYTITMPDHIDTHRAVATPKGRKIDPSGFIDAEFYVWRNRLFTLTQPIEIKYMVIADEVNVRTAPSLTGHITGSLHKGDIFYSQALKTDETGAYVHGINTWAHVTRGVSHGKPVNGLGFVHTANLTIVG